MHDPLQRALVSVRATVDSEARVKVFARKHQQPLGKAWSFDREEPEMTGAETVLGVLVADVLGLFLRLAKQRRLLIDEAEATVKADLDGALSHLGVIGAEGEPSYANFALKAYVGSSAPEAQLRQLWAEAMRRAPLLNTLKKAASVTAELHLT